MKKMFFAAVAAIALLSSCEKPNKCKCTIEVGSLTLKDQVMARPEDKNCSQIKVEDIKGDIISVDLSKIGTIKCVNHFDE